MKHRMGFNPLSKTASHRKAMMRNMVTSLFKHERVTTTKPKSKEVQRVAEKLITRSKVDSVHNRRIASRYVQDKAVLAKLFNEIGPRMKERQGGYTRVLKLGFREGDAAEMAILELVDYSLDGKPVTDKQASKAKQKTVKKKDSTKKQVDATSDKKKTTEEKVEETEKKESVEKDENVAKKDSKTEETKEDKTAKSED